MERIKTHPYQLQHGLSLTSDQKLRSQPQDPFLYHKEHLLKMQQLPGLNPMPGVMIPPHFQGGPFPGFQFRGFPGNFGAGRLPPIRFRLSTQYVVTVFLIVRFHSGFGEKAHFPPAGFPPLLGDSNISLRSAPLIT